MDKAFTLAYRWNEKMGGRKKKPHIHSITIRVIVVTDCTHTHLLESMQAETIISYL